MSDVVRGALSPGWQLWLGARSYAAAIAVALLIFADVRLGGLHYAELSIAGLIVVGILALGSRYPTVALCTVVAFVPLQVPLSAVLFKHGLPYVIVKDLSYVKDLGTASLLLAMLRETPDIGRRIQLDLLDWCAIAYVGVATIYLILPAFHESGLGGQVFQARLNAWRLDCLFVVLMFATRRITFRRRSFDTARNVVVVICIVMLAGAIWETLNNNSFNNLLVNTLGLPDYQYYVLHALPPHGFYYINHATIAGLSVTRAGSFFADPITLGFYMLVGFGLGLERLANHRLTPWVVVAVGSSAVPLILAETRSPILGGGTAIVLAGVLAFRTRSTGRYRLMVLIVATAVLVVPLSAGTGIRARFATTVNGSSDHDTQKHKNALRASINIVVHKPLGTGLGSNPGTGAIYQTTNRTFSENSYLQVGVELGAPAMLAFIGMYLALLARLRDEARRRSVASSAAGGMWLAGWALFIGGMFLHVWTLFAVSLTFWGLAGAAIGPPGEESPRMLGNDEDQHRQRFGSALAPID